MYKKKKKNKKEYFIFLLVLILFFVLIYFFSNRSNNFLFIEKITHEIGLSIESIFIPKKIEIEDEILSGIYLELEEEVNTLKQMLELDSSNYKFIHASVIKRDEKWYHELVINKGENDGIKVDMAVIANGSLIGRVTKTTFNMSYIKLLSSNANDMKVSVTIKTDADNYNGVLDSYLEDVNEIMINNINKSSDIKVGDSVYTNGLGGIYPEGIYIGKVTEIGYDSLGLKKQLKVKATNIFDNISYVTVIDRG